MWMWSCGSGEARARRRRSEELWWPTGPRLQEVDEARNLDKGVVDVAAGGRDPCDSSSSGEASGGHGVNGANATRSGGVKRGSGCVSSL